MGTGHQKGPCAAWGGTEVGTGLLNVIVSRQCIQSRACGDKSALVTKLAMQIAGVLAWSAETKSPQWSGGRVCTRKCAACWQG
jgi:hypothetical protein